MIRRMYDWIYIITPDGEKQFVSPNYIERILRIDELRLDIYNLKEQINKLNSKLNQMEMPYRMEKLVEILFREDVPRTFSYLKSRIPSLQYSDLKILRDARKLETVTSGTHTLYYLPTENEVDDSLEELEE